MSGGRRRSSRRTRCRPARTPRTIATRSTARGPTRARRSLHRSCATCGRSFPTEHSFSIWYGWAPERPLPDMAFSVEGHAYIATYAIWPDPADDDRHRDWVVRHTNRLAAVGKGVYLGDTDFTRRADRFLSDENFRAAAGDPGAPRPGRAVLLLPDRRRRAAQRRTRPPSAHSVWPVIAAAASEARNATTPDTSSATSVRGSAC